MIKTKRILAILVALTMFFSALPVSAANLM